jgi:hypothetical protein
MDQQVTVHPDNQCDSAINSYEWYAATRVSFKCIVSSDMPTLRTTPYTESSRRTKTLGKGNRSVVAGDGEG